MTTAISPQQLHALDATIRTAAGRGGDPQTIVTACRAAHPELVPDLTLARAFEMIAQSAIGRSDHAFARYVAYLACGAFASPYEPLDTQVSLLLARLTGDYKPVLKSLVPLPDHARWLVSGESDPPLQATTIELISKNLHAHFARLDTELRERTSWICDQIEVDTDALTAAKQAFLESYRQAAYSMRASLLVVIESLLALGGATLAQECGRLLASLDDGLLPAMFDRLDESAGLLCVGNVSVETLNRAMQLGFERAWRLQDVESRVAFERAIRARYAREVQAIESFDARERALAHYVEQSTAQLANGPKSNR